MAIYMMRERIPQELCFTANTAGSTVKLQKSWSPIAVTLQTSTDWENWSNYTFNTVITLSNIWDKVYWRNTSETDTWFNQGSSDRYRFVMTWSMAWSWDTNYLLNKNSTTTMSWGCFMYLFNWCTSLTTAPKLPATTLADYCYNSMFDWCTSLTTAPSLPATSLARDCYSFMFNWCTSLNTLIALPATTLWVQCYQCMFQSCSNIKLSTTKTWAYQTAYRIPTSWTWTTSSNYDISNMFSSTWWTFTWTPSINTTYYTSNTVV